MLGSSLRPFPETCPLFASLLFVGLLAVSVTNAQEPKLPYRLLVSAIYKLYTVNESRNVEWVYEHEAKENPVILDAWALANGNFLFPIVTAFWK